MASYELTQQIIREAVMVELHRRIHGLAADTPFGVFSRQYWAGLLVVQSEE